VKKLGVIQSGYIPWKGFFDIIASCDEFIIYDDVQYTRRDWRNKNFIKSPDGLLRLTVPVKVKGKYNQKIKETKVVDHLWQIKHFRSLESNYGKSPFFKEIMHWLKPLYLDKKYDYLSEINEVFIKSICDYLNISTLIKNSNQYDLKGDKCECLINLCTQTNSSVYVSGPKAKDYIDEKKFEFNSVKVEWFDFEKYPTYNQMYGEFAHQVSILDLLFNCGDNSVKYMKYAK
tara:strand:- start:3144 stop:3836 length:693 start_codon:yes stop_codon:yes gene_type:complete